MVDRDNYGDLDVHSFHFPLVFSFPWTIFSIRFRWREIGRIDREEKARLTETRFQSRIRTVSSRWSHWMKLCETKGTCDESGWNCAIEEVKQTLRDHENSFKICKNADSYKIKRIKRPNNWIKLYAYNATHLKNNVTASRRLMKRIIVWSI